MMSPIKTLIVDDNPMARHALKHMVGKIDYLNLIGECSDSIEAINFLNTNKPDLLLLDIEMPEMTGLDLVKQINPNIMVILTTAKPHYAVEAFEQKVIDYLLKPIDFSRFVKSIQRVKEIFDGTQLYPPMNDYFFFRSEGQWVKIVFDDILYIQALGDYATIFTLTGKHTIHVTMKTLDEKLPLSEFQRVHRSYIVATSKITSLGDSIVNINGKEVPLADSFKPMLLEKLNLFN